MDGGTRRISDDFSMLPYRQCYNAQRPVIPESARLLLLLLLLLPLLLPAVADFSFSRVVPNRVNHQGYSVSILFPHGVSCFLFSLISLPDLLPFCSASPSCFISKCISPTAITYPVSHSRAEFVEACRLQVVDKYQLGLFAPLLQPVGCTSTLEFRCSDCTWSLRPSAFWREQAAFALGRLVCTGIPKPCDRHGRS